MKKGRRKLKKNVKRGCLFMLVVLIALVIGTCWFVQWSSFERTEVVADTVSVDTTALVEMRGRLEQLMQSPQSLDTSTIAIAVCDLQTGLPVYTHYAERLAPPASCMKLLTAVAAMQFLGVKHSFVTQVVTYGERSGATLQGNVVFQLDDDPMVETLKPMVDAIWQQGITRIDGDVVLQLMREDTLKAHHTAATWDIPYNKLPILLKGRERIERELRDLLTARGIVLKKPISYDSLNVSNASSSSVIYRHETPLTEVLAPMLIHSSNIKADALFYHIAQRCNGLPGIELTPSQWLWCQAALISSCYEGFVINDGSGLSPDNRLTAQFLVDLLQYVWQREDMRRILIEEALATPGHPIRHGSLLGRMWASVYRNKIFVKTGTLTSRGLSSLAGYAQASDGRWLAFAIINENSPVADSRIFQDAFCRELVR